MIPKYVVMISSRIISSSGAVARRTVLQTKRFFSAKQASSKTSTTKLSSAAAISIACSLLFLNDPISSAIFDNNDNDNVNNSYWAKELEQDVGQQNVQQKTSTGSRLRNAHKFRSADQSSHTQSGDTTNVNIDNTQSSSVTDLPKQARIVIVGGGFAGLHTALALAEKMSALNNGNDKVDDGNVILPPENECNQIQPSRSTTISWYQWLTRPFVTSKPSPINNPHSRNSNINYDIILLEANQIGVGSSGRAKGLVVPGFQVPLEDLEEGAVDNDSHGSIQWTVPSLLYKFQSILPTQIESNHPRYTKDVVREMYKLSYIALDRLRSVVDLYTIDCDWIESGAVEGSIHAMEEEEEEGEEESDGCRILDREEVNEMMGRSSSIEGSDFYQWGEYDPGCAAVNPLKLTIGLADAVERWGVRIYEQTKLTNVEKTLAVADEKDSRGKYTITTNDGSTILCDHVVLCTGADTLSSDVSHRLKQSFVPIYTWMAATQPLYDECPLKDKMIKFCDDGQCQLIKDPAPMCGDDHISLNYWRNNNKDEGRLLFGSLADTFSLPNWLISWRLQNAIKEVYPQLENVRFDHIWGGKLAFAPNSMPLIGRDTDYDDTISDAKEESQSSKNSSSGVWYATGFAGHGIVPTTMAGSLVANAILAIPDQQQWQLFQTYFPPSSFNGYPYSRLGGGMVLSVYNIWDWAGKKGIPLPALPKLW